MVVGVPPLVLDALEGGRSFPRGGDTKRLGQEAGSSDFDFGFASREMTFISIGYFFKCLSNQARKRVSRSRW
jgi:hypothetical protein